jgi:hypothetical protein
MPTDIRPILGLIARRGWRSAKPGSGLTRKPDYGLVIARVTPFSAEKAGLQKAI